MTQPVDPQTQALLAIAQKLDAIAAQLGASDGPELGFSDDAGIRTVYVARENENQSFWYFWDGQSRDDIQENSVVGYIRELEVEKREHSRGVSHKLKVLMDCGKKQYRICSGVHTNFSKGLLSCLASLTPEQIKNHPIRIIPRGGDDPKIVFCSVYLAGAKIDGVWPQTEDDVRHQYKAAKINVDTAKDL